MRDFILTQIISQIINTHLKIVSLIFDYALAIDLRHFIFIHSLWKHWKAQNLLWACRYIEIRCRIYIITFFFNNLNLLCSKLSSFLSKVKIYCLLLRFYVATKLIVEEKYMSHYPSRLLKCYIDSLVSINDRNWHQCYFP